MLDSIVERILRQARLWSRVDAVKSRFTPYQKNILVKGLKEEILERIKSEAIVEVERIKSLYLTPRNQQIEKAERQLLKQ